MVHRITQEEFGPVHSRESLIVHRHACAPETTQNIIFVHGLNGRRYSTWGKFPHLFFEDHPSVDVSLYDYASGLRRIRRGASMSPADHATLLAEVIRDEEYAQTVLIGHSMGGLVCMGAVQKMIESGLRTKDGVAVSDRVAGLFLMATPMAGSLRAVPPFSWLSSDGRVLRAHSGYARGIGECFTNKLVIDIDCAGNGGLRDRHCVPTYGVIGMKDMWVDRFSAGVSIPVNQKKHASRTHTSVTKPSGREDDIYNWVRLRIADCFDHAGRCPSRRQAPAAGDPGARPAVQRPAELYERIMKSLPEDRRMIFPPQDWGS